MLLTNNLHSVFSLNYHLILPIKGRIQVITKAISNRAKEIFENISPKYNISVTGWEYDADHMTIQFAAHPNTEISKFINAYKSASSRLIKKEFPFIKEKLDNNMFWAKSFCLISVGDASEFSCEIQKYLDRQTQTTTRKEDTHI